MFRLRALLLALLLLLAAGSGCRTLARRQARRPPYRRVSPSVAYEIMADSPGMLVLDLRPAQAFFGDTGHLHNARNIPLARLSFRLIEISLFREETVLVYCDTSNCAEEGAAVLASSGFENIFLMAGGIDRWIHDGYRTELPAGGPGLPRPIAPAPVAPALPPPAAPTPAPAEPTPPPPPPPSPHPTVAPLLAASRQIG
jgi:rhodanese-related sulfurtransferase